MDGEAEQLKESSYLSAQPLGISYQTLLHKVREGSDQQDTALREGEILQQGVEKIAELTEEASLYADDCRAFPIQRWEGGRKVLVSEDHQFPPPGPLLLVSFLRHELVVDVAAHADPVRAGEASGADQQLGRILRDERLVVVGAAFVFKAAASELVDSGSGTGGEMLASDLSLNSDKFATPRDWGEGVSAVGGPLRVEVSIRDASRARITGIHGVRSISGPGRAGLLQYLSNHPAGLLPGGFGGCGGGSGQRDAPAAVLFIPLHRGLPGGRQEEPCTEKNYF